MRDIFLSRREIILREASTLTPLPSALLLTLLTDQAVIIRQEAVMLFLTPDSIRLTSQTPTSLGSARTVQSKPTFFMTMPGISDILL